MENEENILSQEDRIDAMVSATAEIKDEEVVQEEVIKVEGADTTEALPNDEPLGVSTPIKSTAETLKLYREKNNQQVGEIKTKDARIAELEAKLESIGKETPEPEVVETVETPGADEPQDVQAIIDATLAKRDAATQAKADEAKLVETVEAFMEESKITDPDKVVEFFDHIKETLGLDLVKNPNAEAMKTIWNGGSNEGFRAKVEQQILLDIKNGKVKPNSETKKITETTETKKQKQKEDEFDKVKADMIAQARGMG